MHEEGAKKNLYFLETAPHDDINLIERYMIFEGKQFMINGNRSTAKMTWQEFTEWQRWDEFPEKADDPPMTVDVMFFYKGNTYYIDWNMSSTIYWIKTGILSVPIRIFLRF